MKTNMKRIVIRIMVPLLAALLMIVGLPPSAASATETEAADTEAAIKETIENDAELVESVPEGDVLSVDLPDTVDDPQTLDTGEATVEVGLPEENTDGHIAVETDSGVVFTDPEAEFDLSSQTLKDPDTEAAGVRSLIVIKNVDAPKTYRFPVELADGQRLVASAELLGFDTGELFILDVAGEVVSVVDPAWAKDGNNQPVETSYAIENGDTLVQTVEFDDATVFPVVADPSIWQIMRCGLEVAKFLAGLWVPGSKVFKVAKAATQAKKFQRWVKSVGGTRKAASALLKGKQTARTQFLELAAVVSGGEGIQAKCF